MFVNGSGRNEHFYRGPSIDASYQVSVHLAKRFQRRCLKCEKLTDDRRKTPTDAKSSHCFWQGELKMRTLYRGPSIECFLPSFGSYGHAVSEEKIFRNRKQELHVAAMFVNGSGQNVQSL